MKYFIVTICLVAIIVFFGSCKKDSSLDNVKHSTSIVGTWELRKVTGGFRGTYPEKNYAPGNGNIWTFSDSTYQTYDNNIWTMSGSYSLGKDSSHATGRNTDFVMLSNNNKIYFEIDNNVMTLYWGEIVYDGAIEKYERLVNHR